MSEYKIKVSVIVPIYNGAVTLKRCLDSLKRQTIDAYEVICIDDGSTDDSAAILDYYQAEAPELFHVVHTMNQGASTAREAGIAIARGKYIGFVDCDDEALSDMYELLYNIAEAKTADIAVCGYKRVRENRDCNAEMCAWKYNVMDVEHNLADLAVINTALWNKLYRSSILQNRIHFQYPPRVAEDMMLLLSLYPFCKKIAFLNKVGYLYYATEGTAMTHFSYAEMNLLCQDMEQTRKYVMDHVEDKRKWNFVCELFILIHLGFSVILRTERKEQRACIDMVYSLLKNSIPDWNRNFLLRGKNKQMIKVKIIYFSYIHKSIYLIMKASRFIIELIRW